MLGISVDFLSLIERGRNSPSFEKIEAMAKGLGRPVAYLFIFEDAENEREIPTVKRLAREQRTKVRRSAR